MKKLLILAGLAAAAAGVARILASGSVTTEQDDLDPAYVGEPADKSEDVSAFDDDRDDTGDPDTDQADEAQRD